MNRKRAFWMVGLLAGVITILLLHFNDWMVSRRLAHENFSQVRDGMSQAEVEALLGGPPGNYGRYSGDWTEMTQEGYMKPTGSVERIWCDDFNRFEIYFDEEDRVVGRHRRAGYSQIPREGFLRWLRRMIGL